MNYYDNQANVIDYIKPNRKRNDIDLDVCADDELAELLETMLLKRQGLQEMYQGTQNEFTLKAISKLTSFISAIRMQMRKRKLVPYSDLTKQIICLESQLKDLNSSSTGEQDKRVKHLEAVNDSLKGEVKTLKPFKEKVIQLKDELTHLRAVIAENREVEKTKRHAMSVESSKYKYEYCRGYLKDVLPESEYNEMIEYLKGME